MKVVVFDVETTSLRGKNDMYFKKMKTPDTILTVQKNYKFRGEVIQISALETSLESLCQCKNFYSYYTDPTEPISVGAMLNAHGISDQPDCYIKSKEVLFAEDTNAPSVEKLLANGFKKAPYIRSLAKGKSLEHYLCDVPEFSSLFRSKGTIFVGHNIKGFDMGLINQQLVSSNCPEIDFGTEISSFSFLNPNKNYFFDTMFVSKILLKNEIVALTGRYKNPKLSEALNCLGLTEEDAHSIAKDVLPNYSESMALHNSDFDVIVNWLVFILLVNKINHRAL